MEDKKNSFKPTPIDVLPGHDPDVIGKHYQNLHKNFYSRLGQDVEVDYTKDKLPDGKTRVQIVVDKPAKK
ncbi:MAG: hypothetical protein NTV24_01155 [Candidatus Woesebacteria bacterium]|nr:hypothetical protein [Candidatus Woesebacteria bacterium]